MRVFCYFKEPASYTIDLAKNIYEKNNIKYCFINSYTEAKSNKNITIDALDQYSIFLRIKFIIRRFISSDFLIINGYDNYVFIITYILNLFSFKKRIIAIESDTQYYYVSNFFKRFIKSLYLSVIFSKEYVLGFSGGSKIHKELFRYYGMCNDRIFLMPMMINNTRFYRSKKKKDIIFTFLYVGRLINTKNVDVLCEKFIKNFSKKKAQLIVVGDGDLLKKYKTLYASSKVHFKGNVFGEELIDIYHNSSVFILPSTSEQWGLVINEALCSGLPVIVRKEVGAIYDLILNKKTGFIIDNWFELENYMLELYNNRDLIEEYSNNAVVLMKEQWNYKLYEQNLLKAINIY